MRSSDNKGPSTIKKDDIEVDFSNPPWRHLYVRGCFENAHTILQKRRDYEEKVYTRLASLFDPASKDLASDDGLLLKALLIDHVEAEEFFKKNNIKLERAPYGAALARLAESFGKTKEDILKFLCECYVRFCSLDKAIAEVIEKINPEFYFWSHLYTDYVQKVTPAVCMNRDTFCYVFSHVDTVCDVLYKKEHGHDEVDVDIWSGANQDITQQVKLYEKAFDSFWSLFIESLRFISSSHHQGFLGNRHAPMMPRILQQVLDDLAPKPGMPPRAMMLYAYYRFKTIDSHPLYKEEILAIAKCMGRFIQYQHELNHFIVDNISLGKELMSETAALRLQISLKVEEMLLALKGKQDLAAPDLAVFEEMIKGDDGALHWTKGSINESYCDLKYCLQKNAYQNKK